MDGKPRMLRDGVVGHGVNSEVVLGSYVAAHGTLDLGMAAAKRLNRRKGTSQNSLFLPGFFDLKA